MTRQEFQELLEKKIVILDGATGSNLQKRGMPQGVCPEKWITEHPDVMIGLQREYIAAGSDVVYAPTFGANRIKLEEYGLLDELESLNRTLVAISREATEGKALVAADITMTGAQLEPLGNLTFDELVDVYRQQISILADAGVDLIGVETMMSLQETRAAVQAAKEVCELPVIATLSFQENGMTLYGVSAESAVAVLQGMGVDAIGLNCSAGPDRMMAVIERMKAVAKIPIIAKPNAGLPTLLPDGTTGYDMTPEMFCEHMKTLLEKGAGVAGGCCGTAPEYIRLLSSCANTMQPPANQKNDTIYLATERHVYSFEPGQKLAIGTDIDFAENEELVEDYQDDCFDTAVDLAFDMEEECDLIRIAAKADRVEEKQALLAVAEELSRSVNVPCMIDSDDPDAIEYVVKHFSGIMAIKQNYNLKEWETKIKSIAKAYQVPIVTIDNEIIYC